MPDILLTTVTGGYNGGATIKIKLNDTQVFIATGSSPYNSTYNPLTGSFTYNEETVNITINPPASNTAAFTIDITGGIYHSCENIRSLGANNSYGYDYTDRYVIPGSGEWDPDQVLYLPCDLSPFPIYVGQNAFDALDNISAQSGVLLTYVPPSEYVTEGYVNPSALYEELIDIIPINTIRYLFLYNSELDFSPFRKEIFNYAFPSSILSPFTYVSDKTDNYSIQVLSDSNSRIVRVKYGMTSLPETWQKYTNSSLVLNNSDITSSFEHIPYGGAGLVASYSTMVDTYKIEIIVGNNDLTEFKIVVFNIGINNRDEMTFSIQSLSTSTNELFSTYFNGIIPVNPPVSTNDPYLNGGSGSHGGGGTGKFSRTGDEIGIPSLPTLTALDSGFITLFTPTKAELNALASYMWTGLFDIDTFRKIFANPMDCILGMSIVPVNVPSGGSAEVKVGNISTGVSMTKANQQYVSLNCGSLKIEEYWGAFLDYAPYTKCTIYLPYIGMRDLSIDDVMNKTLKVVYHIDILSGACIAYIQSNNTVVYSFIGQCSSSIPITGNDWTNVINGILGIAGAIGTTVASGGLTTPIAIGSVASAASTVASSKPDVGRSGAVSGTAGLLGVQTPYLIITWPKECIPNNQNSIMGYPAFVHVNLSDIVGYNKISEIHLEECTATDDEKNEIENILKMGVIF